VQAGKKDIAGMAAGNLDGVFAVIPKKGRETDEAHESRVVARRQVDGIVVYGDWPDGGWLGTRSSGAIRDNDDGSGDGVSGKRSARLRDTGVELAIVYDGERPTCDGRQHDGYDSAGRIFERKSGSQSRVYARGSITPRFTT